MATADQFYSDDLDTDNPRTYSAEGETRIEVDQAFISSSDMVRDGQDLVLSLESGETITIEGYFAVETPPLLVSETGHSLTPQLVNSFAHGLQYAEAANGTSDASPIGVIKEVSGKATVTRTDGSEETITLGTAIYEGDVIETEGDGAVNIIFIDETEFAVSENARLAIDEYVFDPATQEGTTNFSVLSGVFAFTSGLIGRDDPDDVEIETPVGSIGIRGTIIAGKIDPDGGDNQITVIEGAIVVKNATGETTLSSQFETVRLSGFESKIINIGTLDAAAMNASFGAISGVSASLFSAINDTSHDSNNGTSGKQDGAASGTDASSATDGDGASQPASESAPNNAPADAAPPPAPPVVSPSTKPTLGTGLSGADTSGLAADPGLHKSAPVFSDSAASHGPAISAGTAPAIGASNLAPPPASIVVQPPEPATILQPPPSVINGGGGTTGGTGGNGGGGTVIPTPTSPFDLHSLTNNAGIGFTINGNTGAGIGLSLSAGGDLTHNGHNYLLYTDANGHYYTAYLNGTYATVSQYNISTLMSGPYDDAVITGGADFNNDGNIDYIIGAPQALGTATDSGQIALVTTGAYVVANGAPLTTQDSFGKDVAILNDFNGDGYSDYAIGSPTDGTSVQGRVYIGLGSAARLAGSISLTGVSSVAGTASNTLLGNEIESAGDINNDGFDDLLVSTLANRAYLIYGNAAGTVALSAPILGSGTNFGENVAAGGDLNGDGFSDFVATSVGTDGVQANIFRGSASTPLAAGTILDSRANWEISSGDFIGDYNGDGFDDLAIVSSNTTEGRNSIWVLLGSPSANPFGSVLDLGNIPAAFADKVISFTWDGVGDIEIAAVGDMNGDGLDDVGFGAVGANGGNGAIKVIFGEEGATRIGANIVAAAAGEALLGAAGANSTLRDSGLANVRMTGRDGDDVFHVSNQTVKVLDGNGGYDTVMFDQPGATLNLSNLSKISGIEEIRLTQSNQTLLLSSNDLFKLLKESENGELFISSNGTGNNVDLMRASDNTVQAPTSLGFTDEGTSTHNGETYTHYQFGEYSLYIEQGIS